LNFNSWQYLVFFPIIFALYYAITWPWGGKSRPWSNKASQVMLLAASLFFYGCWNPKYLFLILFSVAITWLSGLLMDGKAAKQKGLVLLGSLVINLGILFFFKYYNFFAATLARFTAFRAPAFDVLLPVGISFYTFQALGYSIDVYRGTVKAERNFINYALFVTFFPQLVAGPIERTSHLLPQFKVNHAFDYDQVTSGLKLAAWGMFKKVVVADRLAVYVNGVYAKPSAFPACTLALATVFFAFQIYCDFSGYSDIAIGCARALGFDLMTNFRRPYFARSVTDFWRRWHISLLKWFTDYLFMPINVALRKWGKWAVVFATMVTFLLSGLWHGAAWHFVVWGGLHCIYLSIGLFKLRYRKRLWRILSIQDNSLFKKIWQILITFVLVDIGYIFFRADSIASAFSICEKLTTLPTEIVGYISQVPQFGIKDSIREMFCLSGGSKILHPIEGCDFTGIGLTIICLMFLFIGDMASRKVPMPAITTKYPLVIRWTGYVCLLLILFIAMQTKSSQFIYFKF
jgi:D-alanyl-lipoteichoic acid acyltransferase DltB (MBOAT superfamily)